MNAQHVTLALVIWDMEVNQEFFQATFQIAMFW